MAFYNLFVARGQDSLVGDYTNHLSQFLLLAFLETKSGIIKQDHQGPLVLCTLPVFSEEIFHRDRIRRNIHLV